MKRLFDYIFSLNEMAYDKSEYAKEINSLDMQIVQNWCLTKYGTKTRNLNRNHWAAELQAYIFRLQSRKIKNDNKASKIKHKLLVNQLINKAELNDVNVVRKYCLSKMWEENIDTESETFKTTCREFAKSGVYELIDLICVGTEQSIKKYCNNL